MRAHMEQSATELFEGALDVDLVLLPYAGLAEISISELAGLSPTLIVEDVDYFKKVLRRLRAGQWTTQAITDSLLIKFLLKWVWDVPIFRVPQPPRTKTDERWMQSMGHPPPSMGEDCEKRPDGLFGRLQLVISSDMCRVCKRGARASWISHHA